VVDRAHPGDDRARARRLLGDRIAEGQVAASDADLILAVLDRDDREAFAELVRRHQSKIRTVLRRLTGGDAAFAEDLAQDTFVLAWRNLRSFRFEARFSTWLYRIAFNAWQSEARKRRELLLESIDDAPEGDTGAFEDAPDVASRVDLERAIATLSDGERAAIAACYYADLSHEEAAAALGIPLGTVKTHVLRAKAKLRARLKETSR
jgi:RNA polymerase sigma factor (sigma-70 family)